MGLRTRPSGDRLDYTKGIPEKFRAIDLFLDQNPQYKKRFVYVQLGAPSREHIPSYKQISEEIEEWVEKINWKHRSDHWSPILYLREHIPFLSVLELLNYVEPGGVLPIYIGDDQTDEDAFRALKGKGVTIFVGSPGLSSARYYVKDPSEVFQFLKIMEKEVRS